MAGLFGFVSNLLEKESSSVDYKDEVSAVEEESSDLTGVAKYVQSQKPAPSSTGVAKYLKSKRQNVPSGVAKYLSRQAITSKQKLEIESTEVTTGVAAYLKNNEDRPKIIRSGVAKYLASNNRASASSVSKYLARKLVEARNAPPIPKVTGVAQYLESRTEVLTTGVNKYLVKQALAARQLAAETVAVVESVVVIEPVTGVEKYLQSKA